MTKPDYLFEHFQDPAFRDNPSRLALTDSGRLSATIVRYRGDWDTIADYIAGPRRWPVKWFPDANVAILPAADRVWDALRLAALGSPSGSTVITGVVEQEIADWLDDPWRGKERAAAIRTAMKGETWIRRFLVGVAESLHLAILSYAQLLGVRRTLAGSWGGTTLVGTDPGDKSGTMDEIKKQIGPRAMGLAKKGRDDAAKSGIYNISDEMHFLMVVLYALINRRDSVLLTADHDYVEIFYKTQWFLDTHYRAWLAARLIPNGRYGDPAMQLTETEGLFDGPLTLYRRPTERLEEVLPPVGQVIRVAVLYVAPDNKLYKMVFPFEPQMLDMLATRGMTNGRCTDLCGDANIHVDLGPLKSRIDGLYLGIGKDAVGRFEMDGVVSLLSRLDLQHALMCFERFVVLD